MYLHLAGLLSTQLITILRVSLWTIHFAMRSGEPGWSASGIAPCQARVPFSAISSAEGSSTSGSKTKLSNNNHCGPNWTGEFRNVQLKASAHTLFFHDALIGGWSSFDVKLLWNQIVSKHCWKIQAILWYELVIFSCQDQVSLDWTLWLYERSSKERIRNKQYGSGVGIWTGKSVMWENCTRTWVCVCVVWGGGWDLSHVCYPKCQSLQVFICQV